MEGHGKAGHGTVCSGSAWQAGLGVVRCGSVRLAMARQAWFVVFRLGKLRYGQAGMVRLVRSR